MKALARTLLCAWVLWGAPIDKEMVIFFDEAKPMKA
jgi:hypothetical protein